MDITTITDIKELKALAYDQMAILERTQQNLQQLNARIAQVQAQEPKPKEMAAKKE